MTLSSNCFVSIYRKNIEFSAGFSFALKCLYQDVILYMERRRRCLIAVETLPLKERYKKEELKLEFLVLAIACFNHHSIKLER